MNWLQRVFGWSPCSSDRYHGARGRVTWVAPCIVGLTVSSALSAQTVKTPMSFGYNCVMADDNCVRPAPWPTGQQTFGGVPFVIPTSGANSWASRDAQITGPNPHVLDIAVRSTGVIRVFTLINTLWGSSGASRASLEFYGDGGEYFKKDLIGGVDIRDYNYGNYTNVVNGTTTANVFRLNAGSWDQERRLDMQTIDLPTAFRTQTLVKIRLTDAGADYVQRAFLAGLTVERPFGSVVPSFSDDPLASGSVVNASHITELRQAVDTLRVRSGLGAVAWSEPSLEVRATVVKAVHVSELRTALGAVYSVAGQVQPSYSAVALQSGVSVVSARDIAELRRAVLGVW